MNTYILTGCAGFIGYHTVKRLLNDGNSVIGLDSMNDAYDKKLKLWRIQDLETYDGFLSKEIDITDVNRLQLFREFLLSEEICTKSVVHLAAYAGVRYSVKNPSIYYDTNVLGTLNILELAKNLSIKKIVVASSSSVYGGSKIIPFVEDSETSKPLSPYAASKKSMEELCFCYHYLNELDITALRFFTVYGPAGRPDMSPFRFVQWISEEKPLVLYGDGEQRRDFTFVDDIVEGIILSTDSTGYNVLNLGNDKPVSVNDLISMMERYVGKRAIIKKEQRHPADMTETWADISKAKDVLGWNPKTSLDEGINQLVKWYTINRSWACNVDTRS